MRQMHCSTLPQTHPSPPFLVFWILLHFNSPAVHVVMKVYSYLKKSNIIPTSSPLSDTPVTKKRKSPSVALGHWCAIEAQYEHRIQPHHTVMYQLMRNTCEIRFQQPLTQFPATPLVKCWLSLSLYSAPVLFGIALHWKKFVIFLSASHSLNKMTNFFLKAVL